jgi:hypothetical protein
MRAILKKELHQVILEPRSPKALLCGSDVLFTGREFFVGLSTHTNTEGAVAVASTWPEYPCTPIKVRITSTVMSFPSRNSTGCTKDRDLHRQKYWTPNFLGFFEFVKTIKLFITQKKFKTQAQNHSLGMMPQSKIVCFINSTKSTPFTNLP